MLDAALEQDCDLTDETDTQAEFVAEDDGLTFKRAFVRAEHRRCLLLTDEGRIVIKPCGFARWIFNHSVRIRIELSSKGSMWAELEPRVSRGSRS